jgi:hypothetical protein
MSDLKFGLIGASYVAASRMVPAFQANGIAPKALFDSEARRFQYWRDNDLDLLTTDLDELTSPVSGSRSTTTYREARSTPQPANWSPMAGLAPCTRRESITPCSCQSTCENGGSPTSPAEASSWTSLFTTHPC